MPEPAKLAKAVVAELDGTRVKPGTELRVQFNPESLRVAYANQLVQPPNAGDTTTQWVGRGTTRLALQLVFDVTAPPFDADAAADVRKATARLVALISPGRPQQLPAGPGGGQPVTVQPPPRVRFGWGSFRFDGICDSIEETLELWSADGRPLRSTVQLALSSQEIQHESDPEFRAHPPGAPAATPGSRPRTPVGPGGTVQSVAGAGWQAVAAANGIEDPLRLAPGTLIDLGLPR
jgi:hypothetical protein